MEPESQKNNDDTPINEDQPNSQGDSPPHHSNTATGLSQYLPVTSTKSAPPTQNKKLIGAKKQASAGDNELEQKEKSENNENDMEEETNYEKNENINNDMSEYENERGKFKRPYPLKRSTNFTSTDELGVPGSTNTKSQLKIQIPQNSKPPPFPLKRSQHFIANVVVPKRRQSAPVIESDNRLSPTNKNYGQTAELEEKQIVQTLLKIRQQGGVSRKYKSSDFLMAAINKSKASLFESVESPRATLQQQPGKIIIKTSHSLQNNPRSNSQVKFVSPPATKSPTAPPDFNQAMELYFSETDGVNAKPQGFLQFLEADKAAEIKTQSNASAEPQGFLSFLNVDDKQILRKLSENVTHKKKTERALASTLDVEPRAYKLIRDISASKRSSGIHRERYGAEVCKYLGSIHFPLNAIYSDTIPKMSVKEALSKFKENIRFTQPIVDTIIEEISPSILRNILDRTHEPSNTGNTLDADSGSKIVNWYDIKFSGRAYILGAMNLDHKYEIFDAIVRPSHVKSKNYKSKYIYSLLQTLDLNALEELNEFNSECQIVRIESGFNTSVFITENGGFYVSGANCLAGICLGRKNYIEGWNASFYVPNLNSHVIEQVACGGGHFAALSKAGDVFTWGLNADTNESDYSTTTITGQLGHSYDSFVATPKHISKIKGFAYDVSCGNSHTVVLTTTGIYTFGNSKHAQLGRECNDLDVDCIPGSDQWSTIQVKCGFNYTIVLKKDGSLIGWGENDKFQISSELPDIVSTPVELQNLPKFANFSCGVSHTLACTANGLLYSWGSNLSGELGVESGKKKNKLTLIESLKDITYVSCGAYSSGAVTLSGEVYIWGLLSSINLTDNQPIPRKLENVSNSNMYVSTISCGATHTLLMSDTAASNALVMFQNACKYEGWYNSSQMRLTLLSLADPHRMTKPIQDRAIYWLQSQPTKTPRTFITVDSAYFTFHLQYDTAILCKTVTIINQSPIKVKVSPVFNGLCVSKSSSYQIKILPEFIILPKKGREEFTITVKCLTLPPIHDASGLFHFVVQPANPVQPMQIEQLSRYFIMCSVIPPVDGSDNDENSKSRCHDLAEVMKNEYKQTLKTIKKLQAFIPNSLLQIFSKNPEPPRTPYSETFQAAVIFLDISGFTMLTARLAQVGDAGPETISKHVNGYFEPLINTAAHYGGEFVKSAGLLFFFQIISFFFYFWYF